MRPTPATILTSAAIKKTRQLRNKSSTSRSSSINSSNTYPTSGPSSSSPSSSSSSSSSSTSSSSPPPKWKAMLWTGLFAACTITGTFYGAGLKTQQEWKAEKQKVMEATIDERVSMLESRRAELMRQKNEIDQKLVDLRNRMAQKGQGPVASQ